MTAATEKALSLSVCLSLSRSPSPSLYPCEGCRMCAWVIFALLGALYLQYACNSVLPQPACSVCFSVLSTPVRLQRVDRG